MIGGSHYFSTETCSHTGLTYRLRFYYFLFEPKHLCRVYPPTPCNRNTFFSNFSRENGWFVELPGHCSDPGKYFLSFYSIKYSVFQSDHFSEPKIKQIISLWPTMSTENSELFDQGNRGIRIFASPSTSAVSCRAVRSTVILVPRPSL